MCLALMLHALEVHICIERNALVAEQFAQSLNNKGNRNISTNVGT
jgi:hypothetical protein